MHCAAWVDGEPQRLLYPTDSRGRLCGVHDAVKSVYIRVSFSALYLFLCLSQFSSSLVCIVCLGSGLLPMFVQVHVSVQCTCTVRVFLCIRDVYYACTKYRAIENKDLTVYCVGSSTFPILQSLMDIHLHTSSLISHCAGFSVLYVHVGI